MPAADHIHLDRPDAFGPAVDADAYRRAMEALTGVPATEGNDVTLLRNGATIFPSMLEAIAGATRSVDLMTFVWWAGDVAGRFADALVERALAGVRVRVLLDAFGSRLADDATVERMRQAGVAVEVFRPFTSWTAWRWNMRTHRRALVVDSRVAFTGGVGIADEWEGDAEGPEAWRDTHVRVEGPAVSAIHAAFYSDWFEAPRRVFDGVDAFPVREGTGGSAVQVVRAASQPGWNDSALALLGLLSLASRRIRVTTAYLRPPAHFIDLLGRAVDRGVAVEVLIPGPHTDPRWYGWAAEHAVDALLDRGVRVLRYQPTMHHAKIVTVDGVVGMVGTTNLDSRSLALNEQLSLVVHDPEVVGRLDADFDADVARSEPVAPDAWASRGPLERTRALAAHVLTFGLRGSGAAPRSGLLG